MKRLLLLVCLALSACVVVDLNPGVLAVVDTPPGAKGARATPEAAGDLTAGIMLPMSLFAAGGHVRTSARGFELGVLTKACAEIPFAVEEERIWFFGGCVGAKLFSVGVRDGSSTFAFTPFVEPALRIYLTGEAATTRNSWSNVYLRVAVPAGYDLRAPWPSRGGYVGITVGPSLLVVPRLD